MQYKNNTVQKSYSHESEYLKAKFTEGTTNIIV